MVRQEGTAGISKEREEEEEESSCVILTSRLGQVEHAVLRGGDLAARQNVDKKKKKNKS